MLFSLSDRANWWQARDIASLADQARSAGGNGGAKPVPSADNVVSIRANESAARKAEAPGASASFVEARPKTTDVRDQQREGMAAQVRSEPDAERRTTPTPVDLRTRAMIQDVLMAGAIPPSLSPGTTVADAPNGAAGEFVTRAYAENKGASD